VRPLFAYIDANSGSYLIQVIAGAGLAIMVGAKVFWRRIWSFVSRKNTTSKVEPGSAQED
jgi:phosphate/sulfate permease